MKRMICAAASLLVILAAMVPVSGWGRDGHSTVGHIATLLIKPHTRDEIGKVLKPGETLASIANWADEIKTPTQAMLSDPDTAAFLVEAKNKDHRDWHFDDLPLMCGNYEDCLGFTPDNDVVHQINVCVSTLQGHPSAIHPLSKRNALRWLVHLVGDLHQPLHVGSGYIDVHSANNTIGIAADPQLILKLGLNKDVGANLLILKHSNNAADNLHSHWDSELVKGAMSKDHLSSPEAFANLLQDKGEALAGVTVGPLDTWAAQWASDSIKVSRDHAYSTVAITGRRTIIDNNKSKTVFDITFKNTYDADNQVVVRDQIAKAGHRLAKLLDAIFSPQS